MKTNFKIGVGQYRNGAPYSELKELLETGEKVMHSYGLRGTALQDAARMYARTFRLYYEQNGRTHPNKELEQEIVNSVLAELGLIGDVIQKTKSLTMEEYNDDGSGANEIDNLEPLTPATIPETEPHIPPDIPEEYREPRPLNKYRTGSTSGPPEQE